MGSSWIEFSFFFPFLFALIRASIAINQPAAGRSSSGRPEELKTIRKRMSNDSTVRWDITADFYCSYWCGFRPDMEIAAISVQHEYLKKKKMLHTSKESLKTWEFKSALHVFWIAGIKHQNQFKYIKIISIIKKCSENKLYIDTVGHYRNWKKKKKSHKTLKITEGKLQNVLQFSTITKQKSHFMQILPVFSTFMSLWPASKYAEIWGKSTF